MECVEFFDLNDIIDEEDNESFLDLYLNQPSFFFKADSYPEVLANEYLDGTCINKSCYINLREEGLIKT